MPFSVFRSMRMRKPFIVRRLAQKYHPDAGEGSSSEKFRTVAEAYQTLGDPNRRAIYDQQLLRESRPDPESLIPPRVRAPVVSPPEPGPLASIARQHFDPFVEFEQIFEQVFRRFEALFF
jgi:curved DNA-binding protein CbpA